MVGLLSKVTLKHRLLISKYADLITYEIHLLVSIGTVQINC